MYFTINYFRDRHRKANQNKFILKSYKSIIIDACATTAIEEFCDILQSNIEDELRKGKYITNRYSPDMEIYQ